MLFWKIRFSWQECMWQNFLRRGAMSTVEQYVCWDAGDISVGQTPRYRPVDLPGRSFAAERRMNLAHGGCTTHMCCTVFWPSIQEGLVQVRCSTARTPFSLDIVALWGERTRQGLQHSAATCLNGDFGGSKTLVLQRTRRTPVVNKRLLFTLTLTVWDGQLLAQVRAFNSQLWWPNFFVPVVIMAPEGKKENQHGLEKVHFEYLCRVYVESSGFQSASFEHPFYKPVGRIAAPAGRIPHTGGVPNFGGAWFLRPLFSYVILHNRDHITIYSYINIYSYIYLYI